MSLDLPSYVIAIDAEDGIIRADARGFWSPDLANSYVCEFRNAMTESRRRFGRVRAHVNTHGSPPQSQEVGKVIGSLDELYLDGDRMAILVNSSIMRMQISRIAVSANVRMFISTDSAREWLLEDSYRQPSLLA